MLEKTAKALTRKPKLVLAIAVAVLVLCIFGSAATRINYDILTYLPPDLDSSQGEQLLEEPFHMAATTMLIVEDMPPEYTNSLRREIEEVPGVTSALWLSSIAGVQIPRDFLPEELADMFFSGDATMMIVQYDSPGASSETMEAISQVRKLCNEKCFLAGFSVVIKDTKDLVDQELPLYVGLAVLLSLIVMAATMESWLLPAAFLLSIGMAILYNFGTNIFLGEISYITKAIAAVLQLGVTMDYSIFLYHRYEEERHNFEDKRDAMAVAIQAAFTSLFSSSLTTVAGFLALCFMRLLLGRDIGIVMAKGVVLGVATVVLVLPAILLILDGPIRRHTHRVFMPDLSRANRFVVRHSKAFLVVFLLAFVPAIYGQNHAGIYYKLDESLPQDMPSIVATNKLRDEFGMASSHFIVMRDDLPRYQMTEMLEKMEAVEGVEAVVAYDKLAPTGLPEFFLPQDVLDIVKQDGMQIVMLNSAYETASDEAGAQVEQLNAILKSYDPNGKMTGEAVLTKDLIDITDVDFQVTSYISIAAIFVIIAITFQSISIPVLLVAAIELAIFVNQSVPYFDGSVVPFVAPTVIGCVQLGATVDYAILMTTRFREELQKGADRQEAILAAAGAADSSIITSALVLFCSTLGVGFISKIEIISSICIMLARGSIISAVCILFLLPALLAVFEPVINKTSLHWRKPKPKALPVKEPAPALQAAQPEPLPETDTELQPEQI
ncbi:MAG: MMPL family transporter [Oscillospiraceae bacterium]|nr:MMPL family transporter [Oscillospiraceae bacterium]MCI8878317.1 MMPL family transporter [Oscillospiraceae bacterium]